MSVGNNPGIRIPSPNECNVSVRTAISQISKLFGFDATPIFAGLSLSGLTANRLLQTNSSKLLYSVSDLTTFITGTADEINISDDGDGTVTIGLVDPLIVSKGGTGIATLTDHSLLVGSGTDAITAIGVATDGQLPIGSTGTDPILAVLSEGEGIDIANAAGSITISGENASTTNKGVATFSSTYFSVTDGVVSLISGGGLNHNDLGSIQGGTASQYYHLTSTEHGYVSGVNAQSVLNTASPTFTDITISSPVNVYSLSHNSFAGFVADEHVDHSSVSITAGTGLSGGGNLTTTRTLSCTITQYTDSLARAAISETVTGLDYNSTTGVISLTTGYVIPTTTEETNWNTAYGWGDHAGLYDAAGTASSLVGTHESTYNHANYNTAYGWGDHSGLYDTTGTASGLIGTHESTYNHPNYNTAYGWGDHSVAGYFIKASDNLDDISAGSTNIHLTTALKTNYDAAYAHVSNNGTDHGYIDQDVTTTGEPTFASFEIDANFEEILVTGVAINATGAGYAIDNTLTVLGGTRTVAATIKVLAVDGSGGITSVTMLRSNTYTVTPSNPVSVSGGSGSSATFDLTWSNTNTGIVYDSANHRIGIKTSSMGPSSYLDTGYQLRISHTGDTTSPSHGKGMELQCFGSDETNYITGYDRDKGRYLPFVMRGLTFQLRAGSAHALTVDTTAYVGFGTDTPIERIHSIDKIRADTGFNVNGTDGFTGTGAYTNFTISGGIITAAS
jgi:hypothetical protein